MKRIESFEMLEDIRYLLGISITQFVRELGWPNTSYYYSIKRGSNRNGKKIKPSSPTINKLFDSMAIAIEKYPHWNNHKNEIKDICIEEIFKNYK